MLIFKLRFLFEQLGEKESFLFWYTSIWSFERPEEYVVWVSEVFSTSLGSVSVLDGGYCLVGSGTLENVQLFGLWRKGCVDFKSCRGGKEFELSNFGFNWTLAESGDPGAIM